MAAGIGPGHVLAPHRPAGQLAVLSARGSTARGALVRVAGTLARLQSTLAPKVPVGQLAMGS